MTRIIRMGLSIVTSLCRFIINKPRYKSYFWSDNVFSSKFITPKYVSLGQNVKIGPNARIEGVPKYNEISYTPEILLMDGVSIEQNIHLTCANSIEIGSNTAIAANVTITDINHPYTDISLPVERQNLEISQVVIGEDCKIYNGAIILPGVHIGKHCVIGANSVVTHDIPDYSVAVGSPARVIKYYDFATSQWLKVEKN